MPNYRYYSADRTHKRCGLCAEMLPLVQFAFQSKHGLRHDRYCKRCNTERGHIYRVATESGLISNIVIRTKQSSKKHGVPFNLTKEWVKDTLERQGWKCALTGIPMCRARDPKHRKTGYQWDSISADRIRAGEGYTTDNVRFVLNMVNIFRGRNGDDLMYQVAEALVNSRSGALPPPVGSSSA